MKLTKRTIDRLSICLNSLRKDITEKDTNFAVRISKKYSQKKIGLTLPCPKTGLSIEQIKEILKLSRKKKTIYSAVLEIPKISGEFIENLAFITNRSFEDLVSAEKTIEYLPSYYAQFFALINNISVDEAESNNTIVIEKSQFKLYILKLNNEKCQYRTDNMVKSEDEIDHRYLEQIFSPRNSGDFKSYKDIYQLEKINRFNKYKAKLSLELNPNDAEIPLSFIDDRDMRGDFQLFILLNVITSKVLYSCRTFSETRDISDEVKGMEIPELHGYDATMYQRTKDFAVKLIRTNSNKVFIIDRLSGTMGKDIHLPKGHAKVLLYKSVMKFHLQLGHTRVICLARRDRTNTLLTEYVRFGLSIQGITFYKVGKKPISHWVLFGHLLSMVKEAESFRLMKGYISRGLIN